MKQEGVLSYHQFRTDSVLLAQKVIAQLEFNKTKSAYLLQQRGLKGMEASIISNQQQADGLAENSIKELAAQHQLPTCYDKSC